MVSSFKYAVIFLSAVVVGLAGFVFWPAAYTPISATSECLSLKDGAGRLLPLAIDRDQVYGVALTYPGIIRQGGHDYDPKKSPPVFRKLEQALSTSREVKYPSQHDILEKVEEHEPGLGRALRARFSTLPALLDYEVELGIVLLKEITKDQISDPNFSPKLGYFLANDLQSMMFGILGFGTQHESRFLDQKGSFPGFLPYSKMMWVPNSERPNSLLCTDLLTHVNGELRQNQNTKNRIYTNKQILGFIAEAYGMDVIKSGTAIITGSPAGVASSTPRWKKKIGKLLRMDRLDKISAVSAADKGKGRFLQPGDVVVVRALPFGSIETKIVE